MMPSTLRNEPIEKIEPNDPIDPMENAEPREPIERTEFLDQRLRTEFSDLYDITDLVPVLCRVLMRRVCHGVGVVAKSVDATSGVRKRLTEQPRDSRPTTFA